MRCRFLLWAIMVCTITLPVLGESAESAFKTGLRAEKKNDLDTAFQAFKRAHDDRPLDPKYMTAYLRLRSSASTKHIEAGVELLDEQKMQEALAEFRIATQIDPTNFEGLGLLRRTTDEIEKQLRDKLAAQKEKEENAVLEREAKSASGPVSLAFKANTPVSIHMTATVDTIYKTLARLGGLNILMDPDYKAPKVTFELSDVALHDAFDMLAIQTKTFWRPLSANTILVSMDNSSKRKELQQSVMKTFYLRNASTPADLQEAAGTLKAILDISHIQATPELRSLTLRGTPDQMVLAQKLLDDIDKPKAEVLIDVVVMEVSRDRIRTIGSTLPTTVSAAISPSGSSGGLTLNSFHALTANDISVSISGASYTALASDSNTKVIQRPEVRVMDSEKASLRIGNRIPIATGSFQSGLTQGVNTQFQYIDVGVNIDITPYVHVGNEVTLKTSLEVSSVSGEQTVDGVTEPEIGQRRIEHEARLLDGEVNLIGGIFQDTETKSLSGYPGILNLPILKYFFGQENKERQQSEIVFAIIPHIIRSIQITDENEKMIDLGSENSVTYHKTDAKDTSGTPAPGSATQQPAASSFGNINPAAPAAVDTATTLVSSATNIMQNLPVTLVATVRQTAGTLMPTGTVSFINGATVIGSSPLVSGVAIFSTSALKAGAAPFSARYAGTSSFNPSRSNVVSVVVSSAEVATMTRLMASPHNTTQNSPITLTATVSAASGSIPPTGIVTFYDGTAVIGTGQLNAGTATLSTSSLPAGTDAIIASYAGTPSFHPSRSSPVSITISPTVLDTKASLTTSSDGAALNAVTSEQIETLVSTSTALISSTSRADQGYTISLTATVTAVTGTNPTGEVVFSMGNQNIGSASLANGRAYLITSALPAGNDSITASYRGDDIFAPSTSSSIHVTISGPDLTYQGTPAAVPSTIAGSSVESAVIPHLTRAKSRSTHRQPRALATPPTFS